MLQARNMAGKATNQTDLSDDDYENKSKRKLKSKKSNSLYSDCPDYSEFNGISDDVHKQKIPGWSPSPKKPKKFDDISDDVYKQKIPGWSSSPKKPKISKIAYHKASNNTLVVKKSSYEKLQPITNNEKKDITNVIINYTDDYNGATEIDAQRKYMVKANLITTPKSLSNTSGFSTPTSISKTIKSQLDGSSSKVNYIKTPVESPKVSEVISSTPTETTGTFVSNNFQKDVLHTLTFIKHELRRVINNQIEFGQRLEILETRPDNSNYENSNQLFSLLNHMTDCSIPLNNEVDLNIFEDKISGDNIFQTNLAENI